MQRLFPAASLVPPIPVHNVTYPIDSVSDEFVNRVSGKNIEKSVQITDESCSDHGQII